MTTSEHAGHKGCKVPSFEAISAMEHSAYEAARIGSQQLLMAIHRLLEREARQ